MFVKDIMSPEVEWVTPDQTVAAIARKMREMEIGCLPVRKDKDGEILGMVTDRDIALRCVAEGMDPLDSTAEDIMSKGATVCFDTQEAVEAARIMEQKRVHRLAVLNNDKKMVGMLSLSDLGAHCSGDLYEGLAKAASTYAH